jgi:hypothetical protein
MRQISQVAVLMMTTNYTDRKNSSSEKSVVKTAFAIGAKERICRHAHPDRAG